VALLEFPAPPQFVELVGLGHAASLTAILFRLAQRFCEQAA
jgi:hypothetical protein